MFDSFDEYKGYIEGEKEKLPDHVYEFASDVNRHNLNSPHSLHDSWISSITIKENRNAQRPFKPVTNIVIELLGQMHDREIVLEYFGIESYNFDVNKNPYNPDDTYHGDIVCHEVRVTENGLLEHKLLLASETVYRIVCRDIKCSERLFT